MELWLTACWNWRPSNLGILEPKVRATPLALGLRFPIGCQWNLFQIGRPTPNTKSPKSPAGVTGMPTTNSESLA